MCTLVHPHANTPYTCRDSCSCHVINSFQIKTGAPCRSERLAKYNQLLRWVGLLIQWLRGMEENEKNSFSTCNSSEYVPIPQTDFYCIFWQNWRGTRWTSKVCWRELQNTLGFIKRIPSCEATPSLCKTMMCTLFLRGFQSRVFIAKFCPCCSLESWEESLDYIAVNIVIKFKTTLQLCLVRFSNAMPSVSKENALYQMWKTAWMLTPFCQPFGLPVPNQVYAELYMFSVNSRLLPAVVTSHGV